MPEAPTAELRELGASFNRMAAALREQHRRLELTLVAEGIELRTQEEARRSFGCRLGQGFPFSRSVPADAFRVLLGDSVKDPVT